MISGAALAVGALARSTPESLVRGLSEAKKPVIAPPPRSIARKPLPSFNPKLLQKALAALDQHSKRVKLRDRIAIVDFSAPSSEARLHFLDVESGKVSHLLVAHGSGSDPGHTGYLHSFSNAFDSNASSEGAFVTDDYYVGKHGRSQRLIGLDPTNNNALDRAIVIHGAWYANADMVQAHGKLGRSQGCFAVGESDLDDVYAHLGKGRLLYAAKT